MNDAAIPALTFGLNPLPASQSGPIAGIDDALAIAHGLQRPAGAMPGSFGDLFVAGLEQVNRQLLEGQTGLQQLALGEAHSLHQVMIGLEKGKLSFQLLMQIRNRLLEGYQDIMRMQV